MQNCFNFDSMLQKTKGIVLKLTDYSETSVVAHLYTEMFGIQSYMVHGAKRPKSKIKINMLQPLQLVDMVVYHKDNGGLQRISELRLDPPFISVPYDIVKSSAAIFLNEMIYKSLKQQNADPALFQFLRHTIHWLDSVERMPVNFHLYFLVRMTRFLGFHPSERIRNEAFFDLRDGVFLHSPKGLEILQEPHTSQLAAMMKMRLDELTSLQINNKDRRFLLNKLVQYFQLHIENMGPIHSLEILEEVLS